MITTHVSKLSLLFFLIIGFGLLAGCDGIIGESGSNSPETFLKSIKATDGEVEIPAHARAIVETGDNGYLLAGTAQTKNQKADMYLSRLESDGSILWQKTFGGEHNDQAYDLIQTSAGDFLAVGVGNNEIYLVRISEKGTVSWERTYLREDSPEYMLRDQGFSVVETKDGGFAITGQTVVPGSVADLNSYVPSVLRIDDQGNELWFREYKEEVGEGYALTIAESASGGFIIPGVYDNGYSFFKITADGSIESLSQKGGQKMLYGGLVALDDGDYLMVGQDGKIGRGAITVAKISASGEELWHNTYSSGIGEAITQTNDGNFIVAGRKYTEEGVGNDQIIYFKINKEGEKLWESTRELAGEAMLYDLVQTRNRAIIATGRFNSPEQHISAYPIILRTNDNGELSNIEEMLSKRD